MSRTHRKPPQGYAELSCQSAFSFLRGASDPETLAARAAELGYAALALTDRDGLYGSPRFHAAAKAVELSSIHGVTLTLTRSGTRCDGAPRTADDRIVLLAENQIGWRALCRLVTAARHRSRTEPTTPVDELIAEARGVVALAGPHLPSSTLATLVEALGVDNLELSVHDRLLQRDRQGRATQRARAQRFGLPLVATGGARFARREDKPLHDVLTCVRHKTTLDRAATLLLPNAEFCLQRIETIYGRFRECPELVARTLAIAERCTWSLDSLAYCFPDFETPDGSTPHAHLRELVELGICMRYREVTPAVTAQVEKELVTIGRMELAGYFLVVHDIVRFCEEHQILCQGRGSAANSVVCYALGITSVDPVGMDLLFERFLSEERGEMPDIDIDIAHRDREEVIQYVYQRYGRDRAALAAEVISYRARSAIRDAGKALGFSVAEADALAKGVERRHDTHSGELPAEWAERKDSRLPLLFSIVAAMAGLPRHLSIHVGGMIITGPPLADIAPIEPAAMEKRTVVPWDKDDLAALGIIKIDLLGLGMLTAIDRAMALINHHRTPPDPREQLLDDRVLGGADELLALHTVPSDDTATWDMLCRADTVGVFQVESRAQMNCLPRLRPRCFYDLVVEVALIRPGPIQGDMVHPYLRRRAGREPVTYPHPLLESTLRRTLGIPLFQEQGMKIAVAAAGFSAGEADELRRAMGHKRSRERMAQLSERLMDGMRRNGIEQAAAERICQQLESFADFGFPESHSASFARLVWVSAWLKQRHPEAFLCALLNAQPMGFYAPAVLVSDAQRHGIVVLAVDVLQSDWDCTLQWVERGAAGDALASAADVAIEGVDDPDDELPDCHVEPTRAHTGGPVLAVRLGLSTVRGFGASKENGVRVGLASVATLGPFVDAADFARRTGLGRQELEHLARLGALRGFAARRRQALWDVAQMARDVPGPLAEPLSEEAPIELPALTVEERVAENYAMSGVSVTRHPMKPLRERLTELGVITAAELARLAAVPSHAVAAHTSRSASSPDVPTRGAPIDGREVWVAGMVICRQRPQTASGLTFVTLEDETGFANLMVTPQVAERQREGLRSALMLVVGRAEAADGVVSIRASRLVPLDLRRGIDGMSSHDYH